MKWIRGLVLGRGATATVSQATSVPSGELFAVKSTELSRSTPLQKEQHVLSKLSCSCPYIVKYIGFDITNENSNKPMYNLFMEYVAGGTLHDVIQRQGGRRQLDEPMIRFYTRNILKGLEYLHSSGLVHCDIKSQNVLINKDGAKIADFGCAKFVGNKATNYGGVGAFSGTPVFMAPEVARGEEQGLPADVWALGCTVIEMATGINPWATESDDPVSVLYRIGFSADVPEFPNWLSDMGKDFLSKCLRRDPKERWTAKELLGHPFLDELDQLESSEELGKSSSFATTSSSPSCVLEYQGVWKSLEALESKCCSNSIAERIESMTGSVKDVVEYWTWPAEDWITVRSSNIEEITRNINELAPAANTSFLLDAIIDEELLLPEFFVDANVVSTIISVSEADDFVSDFLNFENDNDNIFSSNSFQ